LAVVKACATLLVMHERAAAARAARGQSRWATQGKIDRTSVRMNMHSSSSAGMTGSSSMGWQTIASQSGASRRQPQRLLYYLSPPGGTKAAACGLACHFAAILLDCWLHVWRHGMIPFFV
jgi:hypothetical protein